MYMVMEKNLQVWADKTNAIWVGVMLYAIGGLVYVIISGIQGMEPDNAMMPAMHGTQGFWPFFRFLTLATIIVGYALYVIGLKGFRDILEDDDSRSVRYIYIGAILSAIAYVWILAGFPHWIASIIIVVSLAFMLFGFMALKNSGTFPANARKGASNLFISMILGLIASIVWVALGWIPLVGYVIGAMAGLVNIIAFILTFAGWSQIKNADPEIL